MTPRELCDSLGVGPKDRVRMVSRENGETLISEITAIGEEYALYRRITPTGGRGSELRWDYVGDGWEYSKVTVPKYTIERTGPWAVHVYRDGDLIGWYARNSSISDEKFEDMAKIVRLGVEAMNGETAPAPVEEGGPYSLEIVPCSGGVTNDYNIVRNGFPFRISVDVDPIYGLHKDQTDAVLEEAFRGVVAKLNGTLHTNP